MRTENQRDGKNQNGKNQNQNNKNQKSGKSQNHKELRENREPVNTAELREIKASGNQAEKKKGEKHQAGGAQPKVKIIPLGGLEQIGMNITAFEYEDSIMVVDCGLSFPSDDMLGIDLVIPDVTYLEQNLDKVKGFVITHGHEDHIGALPYILQKINVPVYGTKLTIGLIENKLKEHNLMKTTKRKVVRHGQSINLGCFRVEFIKTNHSIADAAALAIFTPAGVIVHTGDFKIDYTPVFGDAADLQRFAELGPMLSVPVLQPPNALWARPLTGFLQNTRATGLSWPHLLPMWTGCSRLSILPISMEERWWWKGAAW